MKPVCYGPGRTPREAHTVERAGAPGLTGAYVFSQDESPPRFLPLYSIYPLTLEKGCQ